MRLMIRIAHAPEGGTVELGSLVRMRDVDGEQEYLLVSRALSGPHAGPHLRGIARGTLLIGLLQRRREAHGGEDEGDARPRSWVGSVLCAARAARPTSSITAIGDGAHTAGARPAGERAHREGKAAVDELRKLEAELSRGGHRGGGSGRLFCLFGQRPTADNAVVNGRSRLGKVEAVRCQRAPARVNRQGESEILTLQRQAGNRAVAALLAVQREVEGEGTRGARPNLDVGDSGPGVSLLQLKLKKVGYPVAATGKFGQGTHQAVVRFQQARPSLHPATGGVGPATWRALDAETAGSSGIGVGELRTTGSSRIKGQPLGFFVTGTYYHNGVEITFPLAKGASDMYSGLTPRQVAGPEAEYLTTRSNHAWVTLMRDSGTGDDDPLPQNRGMYTDAAMYYDSPGPNVGPIVAGTPDFHRVYCVQNFTGWLEGDPPNGGSPQRLTEMIAWHSIVDVEREGDTYRMNPTDRTRVGTGWSGLDPPK
jgi:hypothetical protein